MFCDIFFRSVNVIWLHLLGFAFICFSCSQFSIFVICSCSILSAVSGLVCLTSVAVSSANVNTLLLIVVGMFAVYNVYSIWPREGPMHLRNGKKLYNERGITFFHETERYVNNLNIYNRSKNGTNLWDDLIHSQSWEKVQKQYHYRCYKSSKHRYRRVCAVNVVIECYQRCHRLLSAYFKKNRCNEDSKWRIVIAQT